MIEVSTAVEKLVAAARPTVAIESVSVTDALGRILAVDIVSGVNVPPADNSAMDGYAYCFADGEKIVFNCLSASEYLRAPHPSHWHPPPQPVSSPVGKFPRVLTA